MKSLADCRLYTFVDTAYLRGRAPGEIARPLCDGGSDIIQLRAKGSGVDEIRRLAAEILPVTSAAGVPLVINDCPRVAAEFGLICHLGQEDFFDAGHRHTSEFSVPVGLSTHGPDQARRALAADPVYIGAGPVYATATKPEAKPVTSDYLRWAAENIAIPWFAIGGINLANLDEVMTTGASRICVVSAILNAPDIAGACREFRRRLGQR